MTKNAGTGPITGDYENQGNRRSGAITAFSPPKRLRNRLRRLRISQTRRSSDYASNHGDHMPPDYVSPSPLKGRET